MKSVRTSARPRPRRASARYRRGLTRRLPGVVAMLGGGCFLLFTAVERFPEYLGPLPGLTAVQQVSGQVTHIRDGDTIVVAGVTVRFGSLDCAERNTSAGKRATARISEITAGQSLTCALNGRQSFDRRIGSCSLESGRDLAGEMIREGYCGRYW
ncbi:thermonuclease family protein [Pseudogemmobacter faecipullorum]|uniref:TNase-like domain-containing protein n=1 Tax=Pseudogemmobacter faecipullorum TaxID=2755041 RepID=A0ABS8CRK5_9RHOB|nr:hypothetical protein [Pseudogemmobacter faecipullorum]MCB5412030.1 hypothetical protein [Pseudogemmobacter faecipullorum]